MANDTAWDAAYASGHDLVDMQHRALLERCARLAEHLAPGAIDGAARFDAEVAQLRQLAREHFDAECAVLAERGDPDLDDHAAECSEFDYLADEVATTANFDRGELQRFLTLWFVGHIVGSGARLRGAEQAPH